MGTNETTHRNITKRLSVWAVVVAGILTIPFLTKMPWTGSDYVFAGIVLFACATVYELATRNMSDIKHQAAAAFAVFFFIFLVIGWAAAGP